MDTPGGVKTGRQKSTFSPTENSYGLVQVKPQDVSSTKTTDPPGFPFHAAVTIPSQVSVCYPFFFFFFFFLFFFPSTSLWGIYSKTFIHRYNIPLTHAFTRLCMICFLTCTSRTMPLPLGYSVHNFRFFVVVFGFF